MTDPNTTHPKTPWHLWVVGILGLIWNAGGAYDYIMTQTANEAYMSQFTPEQLEFFYGFPVWVDATWALAIWGAVLGCLLLLFRSKWAMPVFAVSLISLLLNFGYTYVLRGAAELMGGAVAYLFTGAIVLIAILLLLYSRWMRSKGVLR